MTPPAPVVSEQAPELNAAFVAAALGPGLREQRGATEARFRGAAIDSRLVRAGDLFVALPGTQHDGHDYIEAALDAGATGVIAARPIEHPAFDAGRVACFVVDDPLRALQAAGAAWRAALPLEVIGITGNVGKTTTKLMAASVLATTRRVQANPLNYNNEIGVPLCLLELTAGTERAVIEHGMYTAGEIALLCTWTRPRIGVVLNVGPVHLERAGSLETIARAKRELVESLPADGHALLNADDPMVRAMASHTPARVWWFGSAADAHVRGNDARGHGADGFSFSLTYEGRVRRILVPLPGKHLLQNVLAAAAIGLADGLDVDVVADALEHLNVPLRLTVRPLPGGITLLDDTYNASPAATIAALDLIEEIPGRRLALLGDMRELGALSAPLHEQVGRRAAEVLDELFTVGDEARVIAESARTAGLTRVTHLEKAEAAAALRATLRPGDVLLIKGSRALALESVVATIEAQLAPSSPEGIGA